MAELFMSQVSAGSPASSGVQTLSDAQASADQAASVATVVPGEKGITYNCAIASWDAALIIIHPESVNWDFSPIEKVSAGYTGEMYTRTDAVNSYFVRYGAPAQMVDPALAGPWLKTKDIPTVTEYALFLKAAPLPGVDRMFIELAQEGSVYLTISGAKSLMLSLAQATEDWRKADEAVVDTKRLAMEADSLCDKCPSQQIYPGVYTSPSGAEQQGAVPSVSATRYTGNNMVKRRPQGSFFIVELIDKNGTTREIALPGGGSVNSLILNLSPESLAINSSKVVNRYQTLTRWVEEYWGDELDQVSFSGKTFSFIMLDGAGEGLTVDQRQDTDPYLELRHLMALYLTNGLVYQGRTLDPGMERRYTWLTNNPSEVVYMNYHPRAGMVKERLYVRLRHDYVECIGYFETFDVTEDSAMPYGLQFTCSFRSELTRWY